ncbi:MAG: efflux RND transporter periplasmic adaptor subunit [Bryobacterales bacterium]|nr:efflux RND transporter periplasmic adaptor subunit [Bryobacterales bacterium]
MNGLRKVGVAAAVAVCTWLGCEKRQVPAQEAAQAQVEEEKGEIRLPEDSPQIGRIHVMVARPATVPLDEVVAPGKIEANPNRIARIAMPVAGRVTRVMVAVGDAVTEGQRLLSIESPDASAAASNYQQSVARVEETKANLAKAEADLSRVKDLYKGRAIAQKEVLSAEVALAQASSAARQAKALEEENLRRLEIFRIQPGERNPSIDVRAPLAGKVLDIAVAAGEYRNDTSAPLMTIADLSTVFMAADVPESQIRLVTEGETVRIRLAAYPAEEFAGTVARIADVVDPQTRTVKVRAVLHNARGRLRPEMFGQIRHEETFRKVPVLPASAIVQTDKQSVVYREKGKGVYEPVTVTFGKQDGDRVPVLSGIAEGDRVVVDGGMLLKGVAR